MNQWQEQFAEQMEALCAQTSGCFGRFAQEVLEPAFEQMTDFLKSWRFQTSVPLTESGRRCFRFALTEEGYLLVLFRVEGVDTLHCEYEFWIPGTGRADQVSRTTSLRAAEPQWVESCFQAALSSFVTRFAQAEQHLPVEEPVMA